MPSKIKPNVYLADFKTIALGTTLQNGNLVNCIQIMKKVSKAILLSLMLLEQITTHAQDNTFDLSRLNGINGTILRGNIEGGSSGSLVSIIGDTNGDGFDDVVVGTQSAGKIYVVFGKSSGFDPIFELSSLDGTNGYIINRTNTGDNSRYSVSGAGDINADGYNDIIIGAPLADVDEMEDAGQTYIIFGRPDVFGSVLELSDLNGSNGFAVNGKNAGDQSGFSVSTANDINSDGYDDIIIGAPFFSNGWGECYLIFGRASGFSPKIDLSSLNATEGFTMKQGIYNLGLSVNSAGDINNDGYNDIIIGEKGPFSGENPGMGYVIFGRSASFGEVFDLDGLDGSNGFIVKGYQTFGGDFTVSSAGDINSDGYADIVIGQTGLSWGYNKFENNREGGIFVLFGKSTYSSEFLLSDLDGNDGIRILGIDRNHQTGNSVDGVGDVNNDGFDDLIVGTQNAGKSFLVFGKDSGHQTTSYFSDLDDSKGIVFDGSDEHSFNGASVSGGGDVNGDGRPDFVIGAPSMNNVGESYLIFDITICNPSLAGDINCNGIIDENEVAGDIDGNGQINDGELTGDLNGNGIIDQNEVAGDADGNATIDSNEIAGDLDGNGQINDGELTGDLNGNGIIDQNEVAGDANGNEIIDSSEIAGDINGNGQINDGELTGDLNGSGIIDQNEVAGDANGNEMIDSSEIAGDIDGNGQINDGELTGDLNGNGIIDQNEVAGDANGNAIIDSSEIAGDIDGNGQVNNGELTGDINGNRIIDLNEIEGDKNGNRILDGDEVLSINDESINYYPNPVSRNSVLKFSRPINRVRIVSIDGRLMHQSKLLNELTVEGFGKGIYLIVCDEGIYKFLVQ